MDNKYREAVENNDKYWDLRRTKRGVEAVADIFVDSEIMKSRLGNASVNMLYNNINQKINNELINISKQFVDKYNNALISDLNLDKKTGLETLKKFNQEFYIREDGAIGRNGFYLSPYDPDDYEEIRI